MSLINRGLHVLMELHRENLITAAQELNALELKKMTNEKEHAFNI